MEFMECNTYAEDNFVDCVKKIGLDRTETKKIIKFSASSAESVGSSLKNSPRT